MTVRVIDLETTGTDAATDAIIEIASVDVYKGPDGYGITSEREQLVFPGRDIPPESSAVHHLINTDVALANRIEEVIGDFATADAFVAHNCAFERGFLDRYFGEPKWVCTYKVALRVWPDAPGHGNQVLRYWLGLIEPFGRPRDQIAPHRALSDVIVTAAIFIELLKHASWPDMLRWSAEPALMTRFGFGKHRGSRFDEVPADYLQWIIDKSDLEADTKFSARYWLEKRSS